MKDLQKEYDAWHQNVHGSESATHVYLCQWHEDALALAPPLQNASVLEVGCGPGDFAVHLSSKARTVTAVDFSTTAIEIARRKSTGSGAQIEFAIADAQRLPFSDEFFDIVFSCECLEHLPNPQRALIEMHRVLKSGGTLVLTTENYSNAMVIYWLIAWMRRQPLNTGSGVQPIEQFFLYWRVKRMMQRAGLRVLKMTGAHHIFLAVPGCHPHLFVKNRFQSRILARIFRPFARHFSFKAVKT